MSECSGCKTVEKIGGTCDDCGAIYEDPIFLEALSGPDRACDDCGMDCSVFHQGDVGPCPSFFPMGALEVIDEKRRK